MLTLQATPKLSESPWLRPVNLFFTSFIGNSYEQPIASIDRDPFILQIVIKFLWLMVKQTMVSQPVCVYPWDHSPESPICSRNLGT